MLVIIAEEEGGRESVLFEAGGCMSPKVSPKLSPKVSPWSSPESIVQVLLCPGIPWIVISYALYMRIHFLLRLPT